MTLMRTSVVLIRSTLIPSAASDWNMRLATLVWLFMPTPKTESLATLGQCRGGGQPSNSACSAGDAELLASSCLGNGEGDVGVPLPAHALHDHVDDDARLGDLVEHLGGQPGDVGQPEHRHPGLRLVEADVLDDELLHFFHAGDDFRGVALAAAAARLGVAAGGPSGSLSSWNSPCTVRRASRAYSRATSTEILISLVVIMMMLMPRSARARNIRSATPGCVAMPRPDDRNLRHLVVAGVALAPSSLHARLPPP